MLCFSSVLLGGSVIPFVYGNMAYPVEGSEGSTSSKDCLTKSSGFGVVFPFRVLVTI